MRDFPLEASEYSQLVDEQLFPDPESGCHGEVFNDEQTLQLHAFLIHSHGSLSDISGICRKQHRALIGRDGTGVCQSGAESEQVRKAIRSGLTHRTWLFNL